MIESGSLTPGIDPAAFGLPAGTALRFERPDPALRALLPGYAVLDSDTTVWNGPDSWALPGWPMIWIVLTEGRITVSVRQRRPAPLGAAMVFGATSCAMPVTSRGGVSIVVEVSPMGWARLFATPAEAVRDQIVPLDTLLPGGWADDLIALLHASDRAGQVKGLLDDFFLARLPPPGPDEADVARIHAALAAGGGGDLPAELGMTPRVLRRLTARYFGYPPTTLRRRARFLRTMATMMLAPDPPDVSVVPPGYHDATHVIRDGNFFLGLTPRRFLALEMPYLLAAMRARTLVLGQPLPLLDRLDDTPITSPRTSAASAPATTPAAHPSCRPSAPCTPSG